MLPVCCFLVKFCVNNSLELLTWITTKGENAIPDTENPLFSS